MRFYNDNELLADLRRVAELLNKTTVSKREYISHGRFSDKPFFTRWGSWNAAVCAAGLQINPRLCRGEKNLNHAKQGNPFKEGIHRKHIRDGLRFAVMKRDNFRCALCGCSPARDPMVELHVDHVKPVCAGGKSAAYNLRTLCSRCNWGKGSSWY